MFSQEDFDKLVNNYNEDYQYLLVRASRGSYECLITSFMVLRDLYEVIVKFQDSAGYVFRVLPYPLSFRGNEDLLKNLGFNDADISHIFGFLDFVRATQGREFEDCLEGDVFDLCKSSPEAESWQIKNSPR
jgi:hypothetical protein